jgi:TRAP transporter TAXI family solute receptor
MKRTVVVVIGLIMVLQLVFLGVCFSKDNVERFVIPTGSMGGSYYTSGTVLAELINKNVKGAEVSIRASGTQENIAMIVNKEVPMAISSGMDYNAVMQAIPQKSKDICTIMVLNQLYQIVVVPKNSPANSLADLKGKKIQMGDRRSGQYLFNKSLLQSMGLKESDFKAEYMSQSDAATSFTEGKLGANLITTALPSPSMTQMATGGKGIKIITFNEKVLNKFVKKYPFYNVIDVPADKFPDCNIKETAKIPMMWSELLVGAKVSDELVYNVTKAINEHYQEMVKSYRGLQYATPENTIKYSSFKLHPGARKYYKEIGLIK